MEEKKQQLRDALKSKEAEAAEENTEEENLDEYGDIRIADEVSASWQVWQRRRFPAWSA